MNKKENKKSTKDGGSRPVDVLVSVTVIIFPDGGTHFFENKPVFKDRPNENMEYIKKCIGIWKNRNKEKYLANPQIMGAVAGIKILKSDYFNIPATVDFME